MLKKKSNKIKISQPFDFSHSNFSSILEFKSKNFFGKTFYIFKYNLL